MIERDRMLATEEQLRQIQERCKNIETGRNLIEQEKRMIQELLGIKEQAIKGLEDKLAEHGLQ